MAADIRSDQIGTIVGQSAQRFDLALFKRIILLLVGIESYDTFNLRFFCAHL